MKKIGLIVLSLLLLATALLSGCAPAEETGEEQVTVTDLLGREVTVPAEVDQVVAIGPGALRFYVYAGPIDYVVGVEEMETGDVTGKPYMLANPDLAQLPVIGQGGPNNAPDAEKLMTVLPDVIFSTYASEAAEADELQDKTGIPVVVIGGGDFPMFGADTQTSLRLIGEVVGKSEKAEAAIAFIQGVYEDLQSRTADIPAEDIPTVYVGGLGARGAHGIESTRGNYELLDAIHANNVVDETGVTGSIMVDKEQLLEWDPDYIFIDLNGFPYVVEDYQNASSVYESLTAVTDGNLYGLLPYNFYSTNVDTAIVDAYYLGTVFFPEAFADVDPVEKADEIYNALVGAPLYDEMASAFGGFDSLTLAD